MKEIIQIELTESDEYRFYSKVDIRADNECWVWLGARDQRGYGNFSMKHIRKTYRASRVAAKLWLGSIPNSMFVLHKCDNPPCCNPNHLFFGTQTDNLKDAVAKGRRHVPTSPAQVLTADQVAIIRHSTEQTKYLVKRFGVGRGQIMRIRRGGTWNHVL